MSAFSFIFICRSKVVSIDIPYYSLSPSHFARQRSPSHGRKIPRHPLIPLWNSTRVNIPLSRLIRVQKLRGTNKILQANERLGTFFTPSTFLQIFTSLRYCIFLHTSDWITLQSRRIFLFVIFTLQLVQLVRKVHRCFAPRCWSTYMNGTRPRRNWWLIWSQQSVFSWAYNWKEQRKKKF